MQLEGDETPYHAFPVVDSSPRETGPSSHGPQALQGTMVVLCRLSPRL